MCESDDPAVVPQLIDALRREFSERTGFWAWIIPALGRIGDPSAVPVLVEALEYRDADWLGREAAVRALGQLGRRTAVPALLRAAEQGDTRDAAIAALAALRDPRAVGALIGALAPEEGAETREAATAGLKALGASAVPGMIEVFARPPGGLEFSETRKRVALCHLLAESGDPRARRALQRGRGDPDPRVAACARRFSDGSPVPAAPGSGP